MKKLIPALLFLTAVLLTSCSSTDYYEAMKIPEQMFYKGQYIEAARKLLPEVNSGGRDRLLFMMECGYMLHAGGDYKKSNDVLLPAAKLARIVPTSIRSQAAAFLLNDRSTNYKGEDFEKVLVHMYLGINFLMIKDYDSARVEFKQVNEGLQKIKDEKGNPRYKQNLMAKYLTATAYSITGEQNNDLDDIEYAYKEMEQIYALDKHLTIIYPDLERLAKRLDYMDDYAKWVAKLGRKDYAPKDAGELITIFQSGRSAIKKSRGKLLNDRAMKHSIYITLNTISLAQGLTASAVVIALHNIENPIPYFKPRSDSTNYLRVRIGKTVLNTTTMEDISSTAVRNLQDNYSRLKTRVAASIATKAAASLAAGLIARQVAKKAGAGAFSGLIGTAFGAGTGAALFSQIKPDLRCWHTLPARLQMAKTYLRPGKYNAALDFIGFDGKIQRRKNVTIEIKKGQKTFINERTLL